MMKKIILLFLIVYPWIIFAENELSPWEYRSFQYVDELWKQKKFSKAKERLKKIEANSSENQYVTALVFQRYAYLATDQKEYETAIDYFQKAYQLKILSPQEQNNLLTILVQLLTHFEKYTDVINYLEPLWQRNQTLANSQQYALLAQAYLETEKINLAEKIMVFSMKKLKEQSEMCYQLLINIYLTQKKYLKALPVLKKAMQIFLPQKIYFQQITTIYLIQEQYQNAINIMELMYQQNFLITEKELLQLAQLYRLIGCPYQASQIITKGLKDQIISTKTQNFELLAETYQQAREYEKSVATLEKAISNDSNPKLKIKLATWYYNIQKWEKALKTLQNVSIKNINTNQAYLSWLTALLYYEIKNYQKALFYFKKAGQNKKYQHKAETWIKYLKSINV